MIPKILKWMGEKAGEWTIREKAEKIQYIPKNWENSLIIPICKKGE